MFCFRLFIFMLTKKSILRQKKLYLGLRIIIQNIYKIINKNKNLKTRLKRNLATLQKLILWKQCFPETLNLKAFLFHPPSSHVESASKLLFFEEKNIHSRCHFQKYTFRRDSPKFICRDIVIIAETASNNRGFSYVADNTSLFLGTN